MAATIHRTHVGAVLVSELTRHPHRMGGGKTTIFRTTVVKSRRIHRESNLKPVADNLLLWDYLQQCNIYHSSTPALICVTITCIVRSSIILRCLTHRCLPWTYMSYLNMHLPYMPYTLRQYHTIIYITLT
jgi:hypothetical protein